MLASKTNPVGVELFSYVNAFFCSNKFAKIQATWVKTLYTTSVGPWKSSLIIRVAHLTTFSEKEMSEGILQSRQVKRVTIDSINKRII